ncbi:hypothetical protein NQ318_017421 [Aromia moschata]|uniref:DUF4817 domain-containing protein n=1 Tax=Aromia moschata TaxID=1265417 RepID=A0AAV8Z2G0_9CUCU|nr:hypothetical protein NQ318_017421 [Aromia moschata]
MSYLSESLKIEILMIGYGDRARTQCEVVRLFRETHPDLPPLNQGTISKIEAQYREMGHVRKVPSKRQAVVDDDTKLNLLLALEENPITPARQLARDSNLNHKTVLKYLNIRKNAHIKCKLFKSYLKMIQIDGFHCHSIVETSTRKNEKYRPYKIHLVQELNNDDPDRRLEFYEIRANRFQDNPLFIKKTFFFLMKQHSS